MNTSRVGATIIAIFAIGVAIVVAQRSHNGVAGHHFAASHGDHRLLIDHASAELSLTDNQKKQIERIVEEAKPRFEPLFQRLRETHEASISFGRDGEFDALQSPGTAERQKEVRAELLAEKDRTMALLYAVLTPEQRERATEMIDRMARSIHHEFQSQPVK